MLIKTIMYGSRHTNNWKYKAFTFSIHMVPCHFINTKITVNKIGWKSQLDLNYSLKRAKLKMSTHFFIIKKKKKKIKENF
jgi:hypothetical protein